ncbi:glycoside hydrolase family 25 protein [Streptomyces sp. B6B3]|uniref:glycoside hydrolase family 25 protein n=1 Tax=Streptomyces sp. B6B3 TaxID=3153570 RepID=UPI00325F0BA1
MTIKGIDVSGYQSEDYPLDGFDFVIVKATEGTSYRNPKHSAQVTRARNNDRVVGHYHFLSPSSGMTAQMDYFLDHIAVGEDEILAVDWEDTGVSSSEKDTAIRHLQSKAGGRKVLLYCNVDFWLNRDTSSFAGDGLWIAQYNGDPGNPDIEHDWLIHQYTSDPIDTNVAQFDSRGDMRAWARGEGGAEEDEMPKRSLFGTSGLTRTVQPDTWTTVTFNRHYEDDGWVEVDTHTSFIYGPCHYAASVGVELTGLTAGQEFQIRLANYAETNDGRFARTVGMPTRSTVHQSGSGKFVVTWNGYVPGADRGRVRAEVLHHGDGPVTIQSAQAEALFWPTN